MTRFRRATALWIACSLANDGWGLCADAALAEDPGVCECLALSPSGCRTEEATCGDASRFGCAATNADGARCPDGSMCPTDGGDCPDGSPCPGGSLCLPLAWAPADACILPP